MAIGDASTRAISMAKMSCRLLVTFMYVCSIFWGIVSIGGGLGKTLLLVWYSEVKCGAWLVGSQLILNVELPTL